MTPRAAEAQGKETRLGEHKNETTAGEVPEITAETSVPRHVAIILDGNGRWAQERGLPRTAGHAEGSRIVETVVEDCANLGIEYLTVYAFSTENWKRSEEEVSALMALFRLYLVKLMEIATKNNARVRIIGERTRFPDDLRESFEDVEAKTAENTGICFTIAVNYGGRDEIVRAVRKLAGEAAGGTLAPGAIDEAMISAALDTAGMPDPDLLIRTGGEQRLSNFLLWQAAYTEFYYTDKYWPDFDLDELKRAVAWYSGRQRRFGGVKK
ncbi:MAG: isoprenyl transferase [Lachnospiraceae bacterium]|nr:isoprenyl transferase [Lachnospiraceae bacterium]